MPIPFRIYHLLNLINDYDQQSLPLDLFISHYFRAHKALGSKDRGFIAETIYSMIRWKGLLDFLCPTPITWEKRLNIFQTWDLEKLKKQTDIPLHIRLSCPKILFNRLLDSYPEDKAIILSLENNLPAPTTVRVNPLKINRENLLNLWNSQYQVSPTSISPLGITFHKKINFFSLPEFKNGLFEVQDEGSQLLADLVNPIPGQQVLDYCSGSGGKTLAFAYKMQTKGQIYLHDIRSSALQEARQRLRRAGIQNAQIVQSDHPKLQKLKKSMDWVLVDVPCSGTGTLRRNPDMKWKFNDALLERLVGQQRHIFEKALSYLKPDGRIVYATCSLLKEENQEQLAHFLKIYSLMIEKEVFQTFPKERGMDGFFGVILKKI